MIKLLQCIDDLSDGMKASLLLLSFPIVLISTVWLNILVFVLSFIFFFFTQEDTNG